MSRSELLAIYFGRYLEDEQFVRRQPKRASDKLQATIHTQGHGIRYGRSFLPLLKRGICAVFSAVTVAGKAREAQSVNRRC